jgi:hypothetical protein
MAVEGGFENEAAMRAYVASLGPGEFLANSESVGPEGILDKRVQAYAETHGTAACVVRYYFYSAPGGRVWFAEQPYCRSATRIMPSYHKNLG